jgi:hypothetical protein
MALRLRLLRLLNSPLLLFDTEFSTHDFPMHLFRFEQGGALNGVVHSCFFFPLTFL